VTPVLLEISRVFPRFVFSQDGEMMGDAVRWVNDMGSYRRGRSARDHRHSPTLGATGSEAAGASTGGGGTGRGAGGG